MAVKTLSILVMASTGAFAAAPVIGTVTASGHFTLQGSQVWGNATLFDGVIVETGAASSELVLRGGAKVQLAAGSRARVFADHVALEAGAGQVAATAFEIDAAGLRVLGSGVRVGLGQQVEIAVFTGGARVWNSSNALMASIPAGRRMNLSFQ